jgi:cyclin D3
LVWEHDEISALLLKEQGMPVSISLLDDADLMAARDDAVDWVLRVSAHFGFAGLTVVLAVNYFDRFLMSSCFEKDKPWMSQLAAVACISIAAKVEETELHLLLDLQVEESKFAFEPKTIMRMELLILSTLGWKMNPVTPFSFLDHFIRRFGLKKHLHWEFIRTCERIVVSLITDSCFVGYLPSVIAASTIILVIKEVEPSKASEYQDQLMQILKMPKEKLDACYKLILEKLETSNFLQWTHKRKFERMPKSPNGVIDSYFSCDSSNDSWALSVKSSPEPPFKKSKAREQQMRLTPINRVSFDALTSHH